MPDRAQALSSLSALPLFRASNLNRAGTPGSWTFDNLFGTVAEISEETPCGALSFVVEIILQAQWEGEPVAWVAALESVFFPEDFAHRGTHHGLSRSPGSGLYTAETARS